MENNQDKPDIVALIELAKKPLKTPIKKRIIKSELDEVRQFITEHDIQPHGTVLVPAVLIYDKYIKWCKLNNTKAKGVAQFFSKFKLYFNSAISQNMSHYHIHPKGFDLSIQNVEFVKNEQKKKVKKRRKT